MISVARRPDDERYALFRNTADRMGLQDAIVEKDFWVCFTLDYLFHRSPWRKALSFKGGTSLSKAFGLIRRFSEDIDLILDWRELGYGLMEPWEKRSRTKQEAFNREANARAARFLRERFLPEVREGLSGELGYPAHLFIEEGDGQTVAFAYPSLFAHTAILQVIRLEIGALAAWMPAVEARITPYAAECYPTLFAAPAVSVLSVAPERTFWEKATILHHEANRPEALQMPSRYSRHYYDLHQLSHARVKETALAKPELLKQVVDFKTMFYPRAWARYEEALTGGLKLVPPAYRMERLAADYASMKAMIFADAPAFDDIISGLRSLEGEIAAKA